MRQIVREWPDAREYRDEVCRRVRERKLDRLRWGRRLAPQKRGIEVDKGADDVPTIVQRCRTDEPTLKLNVGFTEQPRLTLQAADERLQIAIKDRAADLLHDKGLPQSNCYRVCGSLFDEVLDEVAAAHASIDLFAERGIERDGSFQ